MRKFQLKDYLDHYHQGINLSGSEDVDWQSYKEYCEWEDMVDEEMKKYNTFRKRLNNPDEFREWSSSLRIEFKQNRIDFIEEDLKQNRLLLIQVIKCFKWWMEIETDDDKTIDVYYRIQTKIFEQMIEERSSLIKKYESELRFLKSGNVPMGNNVTKEMKQKAKDFPIIDILGLPDIKGNKKCPFHNDNTASFDTRGNTGHCYGCGWHGDSIDAYMESNSVKFLEAVRHLAK